MYISLSSINPTSQNAEFRGSARSSCFESKSGATSDLETVFCGCSEHGEDEDFLVIFLGDSPLNMGMSWDMSWEIFQW